MYQALNGHDLRDGIARAIRAAVGDAQNWEAEARLASDVKWVRACVTTFAIVQRELLVNALQDALAIRPVAALDVFIAATRCDATDEQVAAAIRAARGAT